MNDNPYIIPELRPEGFICNIKDADSDEFNELLLSGLGRFALRGARVIDAISKNGDSPERITPPKMEDFSGALDELDILRNGLTGCGKRLFP